MKFLKILMVPILAIAIVGCTNKEQGGTVIGAGLGALVGSQFGGGTGKLVTVAIGAVAGALIGGEVGRSLDRADKLTAQRDAQYTLEKVPNGRRGPGWNNSKRGVSGWTEPKATVKYVHKRTGHVKYCREYQQTIIIGGREQKAYGTACRQPDGSWKIVDKK